MFAFYKKHNNHLYNKLVELSRNIFFYKDCGLKDTFETRVILIFVHLSILVFIQKKKKAIFDQKTYDNIFLNIEIFCAPKDSADSSKYLLICIRTALHALRA